MTSLATAETMALGSTDLVSGALFADRYEVLAPLGQGGMGAVYRVLDRELGEAVALKTLRKEVADTDGALERFRREVKLARRVTHPNVARTFDLGSHQGVRFLTMELIEGVPLSSKKVALAEAMRVGAEIARGLAAAHAVGVVHRDLKPDNVMLAGTRVAITDFGIARQTGVGEPSGTMGLLLGTPAYMAPEQVEGRELDGRADIYALGIVLFQLITGALPFQGDTPFAIAAARLQHDPPDPRTYASDLPEPIARVVLEAMSRRRDERPDAQAILSKLDELRAGHLAPVRVTDTPRSMRLGARTVLVSLFSGDLVAEEITHAIGDALCNVRGLRVESRATEADWTVSGSVRRGGDVARIAMRLNDRAGVQAWAERFEMPFDPFAIEDRVVSRVVDALRARAGDADLASTPGDPIAADLYRRAREAYAAFTPTDIARSVALFEDAHARFPRDALIASGLAAALVRSWMFANTTDRTVVSRAEELALRALAADPGRGEALCAIGIIRWQFGELAAAARAFEDAVARTPNLAEGHEYLGQMLGEAGHVTDALRHLELATGMDRNTSNAFTERHRLNMLLGEWDAADRIVAEVAQLSPTRAIIMPYRKILWRKDAAACEAQLQKLELLPSRERDYYQPLVKLTADALAGRPTKDVLREIADAPHASARRRSFFYQLSAEYNALAGNLEAALDSLERAGELLLFDVFWLDRCPLLAELRDHPRFARVRAIAAARAAAIWR